MRGFAEDKAGLGFKARREREGGTAREDGRRVARGSPEAWRRVQRGVEQSREEGGKGRLTGGPGEGFFSFFFFSGL